MSDQDPEIFSLSLLVNNGN